MPDNNEFTTEKIIEKLIQYLGEHGCVCEDGFRDGIKFSTGIDTWQLIITEVSAANETVCMVLLHKDNMKNNLTKSKKHKLYKGIPDYHIQKKVMYTADIYECVNIALDHVNKWNPERG